MPDHTKKERAKKRQSRRARISGEFKKAKAKDPRSVIREGELKRRKKGKK